MQHLRDTLSHLHQDGVMALKLRKMHIQHLRYHPIQIYRANISLSIVCTDQSDNSQLRNSASRGCVKPAIPPPSSHITPAVMSSNKKSSSSSSRKSRSTPDSTYVSSYGTTYSSMSPFWAIGTLFGASSVALGAFGAHVLKQRISDPARITNWSTAAQYQVHDTPRLLPSPMPCANMYDISTCRTPLTDSSNSSFTRPSLLLLLPSRRKISSQWVFLPLE